MMGIRDEVVPEVSESRAIQIGADIISEGFIYLVAAGVSPEPAPHMGISTVRSTVDDP